MGEEAKNGNDMMERFFGYWGLNILEGDRH